ncbi:curved DNA-binding protein [Roseimicrobium gellanilyticum]|uniref:Curved DNA-binding protein n=1 Tax=Roseimicrobium gellanilyticum TaxID=748857 RepID=A0A366HSS1_9BACT|nr:J domain-containing protein [Roseimicrobium gellanilyticum]RBP45963.1 curved DNA-binding protein [Roseimicrobium gellanilyticum]
MAVEFKDYYTTLGVPRDASEADIKKAFRKLAREHHPDVAKDKEAAEERFKEINEAYEVLGDPDNRKKYDTLGPNWNQEGGFHPPPGWTGNARGGARSASGTQAREFHFGGTGFSDFFEQFFGGGASAGGGVYGFGGGMDEEEGFFHAAANQPHRGRDVEGDILVTLQEAMDGTMRPISLQTVDPATGKAEAHEFTVRIPAGASEGRRIRVPGKGGPGFNGGEPGDLFLRIRLAAHPEFRPKESDLYHDLDLAPWEAVLGSEVEIPSLDGNKLKLRIPAGTQNGQQLRLRGRGLPKGRTGERGDLYVVTNVQLPTSITEDERAHWEALAKASHFRPRQG